MVKEKYIKLLDVIFNEEFEDNDYSKKWRNFDITSSEIEGFQLRDFADNCSKYLQSHRGIDVNIAGAARITNDFPIFSTSGIYNYLIIKENQIKNILYEDGVLTENNTKHIFEKLNQSAIKHIISDCVDKKIIEFNGKVYDNKILFEKIIPYTRNSNGYNNYIFNTGTINNVSQNIGVSDQQLYKMILSKIDLMRNEFKNSQNQKIDELISAINKKDRKSVLTVLSELCSIGSVVATGIMTMIG
ncbi:MAG: hypothetical protein IKR74_01505 [Bacilli bacterium]|nr:hypothetical protein [Bacilli bacterium]